MGHVRLLKGIAVFLGALGIIGLGWWLGAKVFAWIAGLLGFGVGGKVLRDYIQVEKEHKRFQVEEEKRRDRELEQLEAQQKALEQTWEEKESQVKEEAQKKVEEAKSHEELQQQEAEALKKFSKWLNEQKGAAGCSVKWLLLFWMLCWLALAQLWMAGEASSRPPTKEERQRAAKLFEVLQKARNTIEHIKKQHKLQLKKARLLCASKLRQKEFLLRREQAQKFVLAKKQCPSQWPLFVFGGLVGAVSMGIAWGAVEWRRASFPSQPPQAPSLMPPEKP